MKKAGGKVWEQVLWRQAISCFRMKTRRGDWPGEYQPSGNLAADAANVYLMATYFPDMAENLGKKTVEVLLKPLNSGDFTTDSAAFATLALNALSSEESDKDISFPE